MGNDVNFFSLAPKGRRSEYVALAPSKIVNGVKGSLIKKRGDTDTHTNLPYFSNTSEVYFRKNANGVCQARVYIGQKKYLDFDWSHKHRNSTDGRIFSKGTVHVQVWKENKNGTFSRVSDAARSMNNAEMKRYGPLLKVFCPEIKLR